MKIAQLMTRSVKTCTPNEPLECAARIMWGDDCGVVPVVDTDGRAIAMITDRDICMAAYTQGRALWEMPVSSACSKRLIAVQPEDSIQAAESLMAKHQIRRLAVVDGAGRLVGVLSLTDLARHTGHRTDDLGSEEIAQTLNAICVPHATHRAA